jgi:putative tricarboxylic transport membrane protein
MLEKAYGIKMTYVPFKGGGTVAANLVGKHVDSTVNNPSEAIGFLQAGKVRPLASLTNEPIAEVGSVPTFKSLGKDLVYRMQRSVVAPGGIKPEVAAYYVGVFKKVFDSDEWKGYCKKNALQCSMLTGDDLKKYFADEKAAHAALLKEMGEIK